MIGRVLPVIAIAMSAALLAGCTKAENPATTASPSNSAGSSGSKPTSTKKQPASLGGTCDNLLPVTALSDSVGRPVIGQTSFIVGIPEPNIGRLARLNCQYGLAKAVAGKPAPQPQVEIGISLYNTAARAAARVQSTIDDYQSHGGRASSVTVGQYPGTVLIGYGQPTIVVAAGPRTFAVTANSKLTGTPPSTRLIALTKLAVDATQQFSQGNASPTASSS